MSHAPRIPYLKPNEMNETQKSLYDDVLANMGRPDLPHVWRLEEGQINGPFTSMFHYPNLGIPLYNLQLRIIKQDLIPKDVMELFILAIVLAEGAAYGIYAHELLGEQAGLREEVIEAVKAGQEPALKDNKDYETAYRLARALTRPGSVPKEIWQASIETFGEDGYNILVNTAAFFKYIGTLMNAYDEPVPEEPQGW
jgi:4-carboxymuconolactone decarboxylase